MAAAHVEVWLSKADAIVLGLKIMSLPALQDLQSCRLPCWSQRKDESHSLS